MQQGSLTMVGLVLLLGACAASSETIVAEEVVAPEEVAEEEAPVALSFAPPSDCTTLLSDAGLALLDPLGIELVKGPGSPTNEPIYVEGQTPEELIGGLSCLFAIPGEEDTGVNIVLSAAEVDASVRPAVVTALVDQRLNTGLTSDSAATYWRWGDDVNVTAIHNSLYPDSWYSALLQPGGRESYDLGVALVQSMRNQTTQ
jgi:hypothetical protein